MTLVQKRIARKRLSIASLRCFQVVMRIRDDHRSLLVKGLHETWKRMLLPLAMVQVTFKYWTQIENNINKAKLSWNALEPVGFLWSYWIFNISWDLKSRVKILSNLCNINSDYFSRATSPLKMFFLRHLLSRATDNRPCDPGIYHLLLRPGIPRVYDTLFCKWKCYIQASVVELGLPFATSTWCKPSSNHPSRVIISLMVAAEPLGWKFCPWLPKYKRR